MTQSSLMTLRMDLVRQHFIEGGGNGTITDDLADGIMFVGIYRQFMITDKFTDRLCEFQRAEH
jgi:hypothetical protein